MAQTSNAHDTDGLVGASSANLEGGGGVGGQSCAKQRGSYSNVFTPRRIVSFLVFAFQNGRIKEPTEKKNWSCYLHQERY